MTEDLLRQQLGEAHELPYGEAKSALLADLLRHAEAAQLERLAFDVRMAQILGYAMGLAPAKLFVPFARCLADYDRSPASYGDDVAHSLLWSFKFAVGAMTRFPEIPLDQVYGALDDMARRYERSGHSSHAVHQYRYRVAAHVGDLDAADHWYSQWCAAPRDALSDCVGCEPTSKAYHLILRGRDLEAIAVAEPVLGERFMCEAQPQSILSTLLLPFARVGRLADARAAHRRAYRLLRTRPQDLDDIAGHVEFCARTGNEARGLELLERHLGWLDRAASPYYAMQFAASCALLLRRVAGAGQGSQLVVRPAFGSRPVEELTVSALGIELSSLALGIADRFDSRNGTKYQSESIRELVDASPVVDYVPLSVAPSRVVSPPASPAPDFLSESPGVILDRGERALTEDDEPTAVAALGVLSSLSSLGDHDPVLFGRYLALRGRVAAPEGEDDFRRAAELFAVGGDEGRRQLVLGRLGVVLCHQGDVDSGLPLLAAAVAYFRSCGDVESEAWTLVRQAGCLVSSDVDAAGLALNRASELAVLLPSDGALAGAIAWARVDLCGSDVDAAISATGVAVGLFEAAGMRRMVAGAHFRLSGLWRASGDPERGLVEVEQAIALLPPTSPHNIRATLFAGHGDLLIQLRRAPEAVPVLLDAVGYALDSDDGYLVASVRRALALAYRDSDQLVDASDVAEESIAGYEVAGDWQSANGVRYMLAQIQAALHEPDAALAVYEDMIAVSRAHESVGGVAQVLADMADLLDRLDRDALAAARYREGGDVATSTGDLYRLAYCRYQEALSLFWCGRVDDALTVLGSAEAAVLALPPDDSDAQLWHSAQLAGNAVRILRGADRLPDAVVSAERALSLWSEIGDLNRVVGAQHVLGQLLIESGRVEEAESLLRVALSTIVGHGGRSRSVSEALAVALDRLGRGDEAASVRSEAGLGE